MKRLVLITLMFCVGIAVSAQTFDTLWKRYEETMAKDMPKTASKLLHEIEEKALSEGNYGHYLAAMNRNIQTSSELSYDSLKTQLNRLSLWEKSHRLPIAGLAAQSQKKRKDAIAALICRTMIAKSDFYYIDKPKGYEQEEVREILDSIANDKDVLALFTKKNASLQFIPMVEKREDSRMFNHDLFSLLCMEMERYDLMERYYSSIGKRKAACIMAAKWISLSVQHRYGEEKKQESIQRADSLIAIYQDLSECGEIAYEKAELMKQSYSLKDKVKYEWIEEALRRWPTSNAVPQLQNMRNDMIMPSLLATNHYQETPPVNELQLKLYEIRNVQSVLITITPMKCDGMYPFGDLYDNANYNKLKSLMDTQNSRTFQYQLNSDGKYADYESFDDSITIDKLPIGVYMIETTPTAGYSAASFGKMKTERNILHVSDLRIMSLKLPNDKLRIAVVSATSGQPQDGALLHIRLRNYKEWFEYITNKKGECIIGNAKRLEAICATTATDKASKETGIYDTYYYRKDTSEVKTVKAFTDRQIYRPGQTVHMSAICYTVKDGINVKAQAGAKIAVRLRDSQYENIATDTLTTDEYGTITKSYVLPEDARNGVFRICCNDNNCTYFSVEEYKRPTYEVTIEEPTTDYHAGDTLLLTGKVKAYSGAGIANARVTYTINRTTPWFLRYYSRDVQLLTDTVDTDEQGVFTIRMPMTLPDAQEYYDNMPLYLKRYFPRVSNITAEAVVTSHTGESHSGMISIPLSEKTTLLTADIKDKYFGDNGVKMQITRLNGRGKEIDGKVNIRIDDIPKMSVDANKEFYLPKDITSGSHKMTAICEQDTLEATFVVFRLTDEKPAFKTSDWFYLDKSQWQEDGKSVALQFGSCDNDVHVVYTIASGDSIIENGTARLNNSNCIRRFEYKPEYGDGLTLAYAWTKNGKTYVHNASIARPMPSKELKVEWKTFRNKLIPGQKEQWQMVVRDKDGKPCKSMVMATMYDKSLDAIKPHSWEFNDPRSLNLPNIKWDFTGFDYLSVFSKLQPKALSHKTYRFSILDSYLIERGSRGEICYLAAETYETKPKMMRMASTALMSKQSSFVTKDKVMSNSKKDGTIGDLSIKEVADGSQTDEAETEVEIMPRTNFNETAFFMPQLITDNNGVATLSFTLPESVTTWRIMALAHDKDLRFGMLNDEVIAQKKLMVQPRMPRFLRHNDKATLSTMVTNLSDNDIKANVKVTLFDAKTEKEICHIYNKVEIKHGKTEVVTVPIKDFGTDDLICRVTAEGNGFSDGEQHLLLVLHEKDTVIDTKPIIVNPRKIMMEALPAIKIPESDNAISIVSAHYANTMSAFMKDSLQYYSDTKLITKLEELATDDGSFSWYKGMEGSIYITTEVTKTLARLNAFVGKQSNTSSIMDNAFAYLQKEMDKAVRRMMEDEKKNIKPYLNNTQLDWLYSLSLEKRDGGSSAAYLRKLIVEDTKYSDMNTKATAAIVLEENDKKKQANIFAESIKQHTVYREDMGRYFDSPRALYSWCDYRIPTHTMCIEALDKVTPEDSKTIAEMQRWLVSAKRTQLWDNPINAVNAIHAFCNAKDTTVTATYIVKPEDIKDALTIERKIITSSSEKDKNGSSTGDLSARIGERVKVRITINADRDYDFVTVTDNRPACMEPVSIISGYRYGYYQEIKDNKTCYYYNNLRKGKHVIETEYYIERAGTYHSGKAEVQCTYATEFRGECSNYTITTK